MLRRYVSAFSASLAAHAGLIALLVWPAGGLPGGDAAAAVPASVTVFLPPQEDARYPGLKPVDRADAARIQPLDEGAATISLGGFTFDASKVAQRAPVLFPFVSPGVSLAHFGLSAASDRVLIYQRPASRSATAAETRAATWPLELSETALQSLIDKTWSRRERWAAFQPLVALADKHSPDAGALPIVFQRYTRENALQPYQDTGIRDPRFWTQLGLAADHVAFIAFIRRYAAAHPRTRATIELMFLLDRIAEASEDALDTLLESKPEEDLRWTRESNRDAYRLALQLRVYYRSELSKRGLDSRVAVARHYARVRLEILDAILRATPDGYRASDARFLIGAIHWRLGNRLDALAAWRGTTVVEGDSYAAANAGLALILRGDHVQREPAAFALEVERVLRNDNGRWWDLSYDRLKKFGYRFDTY